MSVVERDNLDRLIDKLGAMDSHGVHAYVQRLLAEKGFLSRIFNAIREGVMVIDRDLRLIYANSAASRLLGLPDDWRGAPVPRFLREVDWKRLLSEDSDGWYRSSRRELEIFYPERRIIQMYLVPNEGGERGVATVILRDVTDSHDRAEGRIESEKLRVLSLLAASVAHEIGNPLNSLYLHLQMMQRMVKAGEVDTEGLSGLLDVSRREVERLDAIINQFLRAVRPGKPVLRPTDLKELVVDALKFMKSEIEDRGIAVKCAWPDTLPLIQADPDQLKQAFYNIVKNSLQAMTGGGELDISCSADEDAVEVAFADSGAGIEPERVAEIFDAYVSTKDDGTGLGLMIVERVAREHGAELELETEPGEGTVFRLRFPRGGKRVRMLPPGEEL